MVEMQFLKAIYAFGTSMKCKFRYFVSIFKTVKDTAYIYKYNMVTSSCVTKMLFTTHRPEMGKGSLRMLKR